MKHLRTVVSPANLVTLARLILAPVLFALVLGAEDRDGATWAGFALGSAAAGWTYAMGFAANTALAAGGADWMTVAGEVYDNQVKPLAVGARVRVSLFATPSRHMAPPATQLQFPSLAGS